MSRTLDSNITAAISEGNISPFFAFQLDFQSTSLYLYTGQGDLTIGGVTYTGVGSILNFTNVEESADIGAKSVSISLSGIPSTNLSLALSTPYQGREVTISFTFLPTEPAPSDKTRAFVSLTEFITSLTRSHDSKLSVKLG